MSEKLKPCQYCNGDSLRLVGSSLNKTLQLECLNCGAEGPRAGSVKDAEAAWNTRTDPAKDAMREALEFGLSKFCDPHALSVDPAAKKFQSMARAALALDEKPDLG